jgi:hypothetical protein
MLTAAGEKNFGILVPIEGLSEDRRELMRSRAVAQPFGTYTQPLRLANAAREGLPKLLITNSFPLAQVKELIASEYPWFRELPGSEGRCGNERGSGGTLLPTRCGKATVPPL